MRGKGEKKSEREGREEERSEVIVGSEMIIKVQMSAPNFTHRKYDSVSRF